MVLSNGSLIIYEMQLDHTNSSIQNVVFSQEILFLPENSSLQNNTPAFQVKVFFSNATHQIILVLDSQIQMFNLTTVDNKTYIYLDKTKNFNGTISMMEIYQNFLYIIVNYTRIDIYDVRDFFQYISMLLQDLSSFGSVPFIKDIAISSDFLLVLENTTNSCLFFDRLGLFLKNTIYFNGKALNVEVSLNTVFIYYQTLEGILYLKEYIRYSPNSNFYLENNIFEIKSYIKEFLFLPYNVLVCVHENLITFLRHSVSSPKNITNYLKKTVAFEGIKFLQSSIKRSGNISDSHLQFFDNFILASTKRELQILKPNIAPGSLNCFADGGTPTRKYDASFLLYYFNCSEYSCEDTKIISDKIKVILNVYQELFESSNIALAIGLGIGFSIAFIITVIFCVYFYKIKYKYNSLVKEISPDEISKKTALNHIEEKTDHCSENKE